jgi:lactoylglutathione lyase
MPEETVGLDSLRARVLHTAYHVNDLDRAVEFYSGVLGMKEQMRFELPSGEWECVMGFVDEGGKPRGSGIILMWDPAREQSLELGDGYSRVVLRVSDVDAAVARLQERDVTISAPPVDAPVPGLRYAMFQDPDGYTLELLQIGPAGG